MIQPNDVIMSDTAILKDENGLINIHVGFRSYFPYDEIKLDDSTS